MDRLGVASVIQHLVLIMNNTQTYRNTQTQKNRTHRHTNACMHRNTHTTHCNAMIAISGLPCHKQSVATALIKQNQTHIQVCPQACRPPGGWGRPISLSEEPFWGERKSYFGIFFSSLALTLTLLMSSSTRLFVGDLEHWALSQNSSEMIKGPKPPNKLGGFQSSWERKEKTNSLSPISWICFFVDLISRHKDRGDFWNKIKSTFLFWHFLNYHNSSNQIKITNCHKSKLF